MTQGRGEDKEEGAKEEEAKEVDIKPNPRKGRPKHSLLFIQRKRRWQSPLKLKKRNLLQRLP